MAETQPRRHRRSVSDEQWEQARPLIKYLYQEQGLTLELVRTEIMNSHNLCATEQMFKKALRKWGIRKNYTREDKEKISIALLTPSAQDLPSSAFPYTLSQRRRIKRFLQEQGAGSLTVRSEEACRAYGSLSSQVTPNRVSNVTPPPSGGGYTPAYNLRQSMPISLSHRAWKQDASTQAVEDVLLNARQYYEWFFTREHFRASLYERPLVDAVFIRIQCARRFRAAGDNARAFLMLHLACENMMPMIKEQPFQMLLEVFRTFVKPGWDVFSEARDEVLKQLSFVSTSVLGPGHSLSRLTALFGDALTITESGPKFFSLLSDMLSVQLGQHDQDSGFQLVLAECFIALGELDRAETLCEQWLPGTEITHSFWPSHNNLQKARRTLGAIRYRQGQREEAERIWLLNYSQDAANGSIIGEDAVINCTHLASLYEGRDEGRDDRERSAFFYKEAFEGALRTWGPVIVDLHEYFGSLQDALIRSDNAAELVSLRTGHAAMMQEWDKGQIGSLQDKDGLADSLLIDGQGLRRKSCDFDAGLHRHFVCWEARNSSACTAAS